MRLIDWISENGKEKTIENIKDVFKSQLNGKTVVWNAGSILLLYWFPPWSLGTSTRGTPNHSIIAESFFSVGHISEKDGVIHFSGITIYNLIFKLIITLYFSLSMLSEDKIENVFSGLITYMVVMFVFFGLFRRADEEDMNYRVRSYLRLSDNQRIE